MTPRPHLMWLGVLVLLALLVGAFSAGYGQSNSDGFPTPGEWSQGMGPASEPPLLSPPPKKDIAYPAENPPTPQVSLRVRVPSTALGGQDLEYRICVENRSTAAAHHVVVRNPMPAGVKYVRATPEPTTKEPDLTWDLTTLEPNTFREIILVLAPTGPGEIQNCSRVVYEHGQCVRTKVTQAALRLERSAPGTALLQEKISLRLTVTNTGDALATKVMVTENLGQGLEGEDRRNPLTWEFGDLGPGESRSIDYQATATTAGRPCNRAVAMSAEGVRAENETCLTVGLPKLSLTETGPEKKYLNFPATFQITVSNPGTLPTDNVRVASPLPAHTTFVSASGNGQVSDNQVQWMIGTLSPGDSRTLDLVLKGEIAGQVCNKATALADRGLTAEAQACTDFLGVSALLLEMVDTDDPVEVGGETSYVIQVKNQGTLPATNVRLEALAPSKLTVTRATGPADNHLEGQRVQFLPFTLAPNEEARFVVYVKALEEGDLRFRVELRADQLTAGPVFEEESTTVFRDLPDFVAPTSERAR